jgi:hypothetical protein
MRLRLLLGCLLPCATAEAITVSFSVLGQPNIAVGFVDIDPLGGSCTPLRVGTITDASGAVTETELVCNPANSSLTLLSGGAVVATFGAEAAAAWTFDARASADLTWRTKAQLLDIMCAAPEDALHRRKPQPKARPSAGSAS